ncbi:hypothetical protein AGDE_13935 [Angomonas deanei]|uniref:Cytochrome c domain-containing protein n=1 Tax=Angomonas deanei TaxID=59799 RepID=A0A7G2CKV2_9TRYP|nr:hypothetical protein AGDE_13935 [Angomonas deanei]CAD2220049.1 hypothetical protein, conserved [Angomonas deanei]|eukprot:EPY21592.1 hypothetical protein AGDE_13935 [Angomonas deanei]
MCEQLLYHPQAPSPAVLLYVILSQYRVPDALLIQRALEAIVHYTARQERVQQDLMFLQQYANPSVHPSEDGSSLMISSKEALEQFTFLLKEKVPHLFSGSGPFQGVAANKIQSLLLESLADYECFDAIYKLLVDDTTENKSGRFDWQNMNSAVWTKLILKASYTKVPHSELLFRLLQMEPNLSTINSTQSPPYGNEEVSASFIGEAGESSFFKAERPTNGKRKRAAEEAVTRPLTYLESRPPYVVPIRSSLPSTLLGEGGKDSLAKVDEREEEALFRACRWQKLTPSEVLYTLLHPSSDSQDGFRGVCVEDFEREAGSSVQVGVQYALPAEVASRLLLRCGVHQQRQSSPLLALQIIKRYVKYCEVLEQEVTRLEAELEKEEESLTWWRSTHGGSDATAHKTKAVQTLREKVTSARGAAVPHPTPFLLFFKIVSEAREYMSAYHPQEEMEVVTAVQGEEGAQTTASSATAAAEASPTVVSTTHAPLPVVHWEVAWFYFKLLNRKNDKWHHNAYLTPEEAKDLSLYVLQIIMRGADPWLTLNVARSMARRHIIDGVEVSLWYIHHIDVSHHSVEARSVLRLLFRWLLQDVGVHLHPHLHHHLIPAARVLVQLHMHKDLVLFYNVVIDNVFYFSENFKLQFMKVMGDLVCPVCQSILESHDIYHDRSCSNCMSVIAPMPADHVPSFHLSEEHAEHMRERRKLRRDASKQRLRQNVRRLQQSDGRPAAPRKPMDAVSLFEKKVLSDAAPLLPGVTVMSDVQLFPSERAEDATEDGGDRYNVTDVSALHQEAARRMEQHRHSRRVALLERGVDLAVVEGEEAKEQVTPAAPHYTRAYTPTGVVAYTNKEGSWTCFWCHGENSEWSSRLQCGSCGAQTGPGAPWRTFKYTSAKGDVMDEIRARIANSAGQPIDAVVAGFLLMLYKKAFKLRAVPHDYERLDTLIERLCLLHERVLAGYLYVHLVPHKLRQRGAKSLQLLADLFHSTTPGEENTFPTLTEEELHKPEMEEQFFQKVFTKATCKVCFSTHDMKDCPLITRDFTTIEAEKGKSTVGSAINLSPEEKQKLIFAHLKTKIESALEKGQTEVRYVVDAYAAFVTSPFREQFAQHDDKACNQLSILLSSLKQYKRAAFVLCHIPVEKRWSETYLKCVAYFNVTEEEALQLLGKEGTPRTHHPYFSQVTRTCCMCFDEPHASAQCPNLRRWISEAEGLLRHQSSTSRQVSDSQLLRRLLAQADGWTSAGPERLFTFYRFLLDHTHLLHNHPIITLQSLQAGLPEHPRKRVEASKNPLVYATNRTIMKLFKDGHVSYAYRLYVHLPPWCITPQTTRALLEENKFTEEGIEAMLAASVDGSHGATVYAADSVVHRAAAPLNGRCVLCCEVGHDLYHCPELSGKSVVERCLYVIQHVASICVYSAGVNAAANYIYHLYNRGLFPTSEALRDCYGDGEGDNRGNGPVKINNNGLLVLNLLQLIRKCWAAGELASGMRLLRRVPVEYVPVEPYYTELWKAAGLSEAEVEEKASQLNSILHAAQMVPVSLSYSKSQQSVANSPRVTFSSSFLSQYSDTVFSGLCRHCLLASHQLSSCPTFHEEVSFGRDFVAAYRMSVMSEQLTAEFQHCYLVLLVLFVTRHMPFIPYHIAGVANSTNAIAAMFSFKGEVGIAVYELLKNVYPQYRRRQVFRHCLNVLQVTPQQAHELLGNFYFPPDPNSNTSSNSKQGGGLANAVVAQHLLLPKSAIRDVAVRQIFSHFPVAMKALEEAPSRMQSILQMNQTNKTPTNLTNIVALHQADHSGEKTEEAYKRERDAYQKDLNENFQRLLAQYRTDGDNHKNGMMMQHGNIQTLREAFEPLLSLLEDCVGIKLGSRHVLFASAIDILTEKDNHTNKKEEQKKDSPPVQFANVTESAGVEETSKEEQPPKKEEGGDNFVEHVVETISVESHRNHNNNNTSNHNSRRDAQGGRSGSTNDNSRRPNRNANTNNINNNRNRNNRQRNHQKRNSGNNSNNNNNNKDRNQQNSRNARHNKDRNSGNVYYT